MPTNHNDRLVMAPGRIFQALWHEVAEIRRPASTCRGVACAMYRGGEEALGRKRSTQPRNFAKEREMLAAAHYGDQVLPSCLQPMLAV